MADVFISYKRAERTRCTLIYEKLTRLKFSVWFDADLEVGLSFPDEIDFEVRAAASILVLWSPLSVRSDWVKKEAGIGINNKKLAPAFIEHTELPVHFHLAHAADLTDFYGADDHNEWIKLLERLGNLTDRKGIGQFSKILAKGDATEAAAWAIENYSDPLSREAVALVSGVLEKRTSQFIDGLTNGKTVNDEELKADKSRDAQEEDDWLAISNSEDYRDYGDFLKRHPNGMHAPEAMRIYRRLSAFSRSSI